jgi:hypothetical protein
MQAKNASCGPLFSALLGFCVGLDAKKDLRGWLDGKTLSTARPSRRQEKDEAPTTTRKRDAKKARPSKEDPLRKKL